MKRFSHISESFALGVVLALAGGLMDAYSYLYRGGVFANAQTGNILLLGLRQSEGDWAAAVRYFFPVAAFVAGIAAADGLRSRLPERLGWQLAALLTECAFLTAVACIPRALDPLANGLTSLACGIQVESFRTISGNSAATTMCIGNLRSATQAACEYRRSRRRDDLERSALYFGLIVCFVLGAVLGNVLVSRLAQWAILGSTGLLLLAAAFLAGERAEE